MISLARLPSQFHYSFEEKEQSAFNRGGEYFYKMKCYFSCFLSFAVFWRSQPTIFLVFLCGLCELCGEYFSCFLLSGLPASSPSSLQAF